MQIIATCAAVAAAFAALATAILAGLSLKRSWHVPREVAENMALAEHQRWQMQVLEEKKAKRTRILKSLEVELEIIVSLSTYNVREDTWFPICERWAYRDYLRVSHDLIFADPMAVPEDDLVPLMQLYQKLFELTEMAKHYASDPNPNARQNVMKNVESHRREAFLTLLTVVNKSAEDRLKAVRKDLRGDWPEQVVDSPG